MAWNKLKHYIFKTLGVQEGEISKVLLMQINIFVIICASLVVKPIANGLFLAKFGAEKLPMAFLLVAVVAAGVSYFYTRVLQRYSVYGIFRLTFIFSIIFLLTIGVLLRFNIMEGALLYLLYIWVAIFALVAASQFWIIANFVFSAREAKRLFGLLGAGAIAGAIFGGYLTSIVASFLSSEYLLFVCAGLLAISIPLTKHTWKVYVLNVRSPVEQRKRTEFVSSHPFQLIRKSRHLSFMAAIAFFGVLVAKLVDFQFADLAVSAIDDPDALTAFFGFWFSTFNVISLLVQLVVTRRVVGTFGVGSSLFFLPSFILAAAAILFVFPELLFAAVLLKMTDASLKQSINKAAMELLILPVPVQIKNQTKTFIDVFVDSIATGCSGLLLIFIVQGLDLPTWVVTVMIVLFTLIWLYLAQKLREEYVQTFSRRIEEAVGLPQKKTKDPFDFSKASVLDGFRKVLHTGAEPQMLFVLRKLREFREPRLYQDAINLLDHPSDAVVAEVLKYLSIFRKNNPEIRDRVEPLMYARSQHVKIEAFEYLVRLDYDERSEVMQKFLNDPDYRIRIAAMISLARESRVNPELRSVFGLDKLISERFGRLQNVTDPEEYKVRLEGILLAMGYSRLPEFHDTIEKYMSDSDLGIASQACIAAGKTADPRFIPMLIRALGDERLKVAATQALVSYGSGVIALLRGVLFDHSHSTNSLRALPSVAAALPSREAVEFCFDLLSLDNEDVRDEAIKALNTLKQVYPDYRVDRARTVNEIRREARLYQDTLSILYAQLRANESAERLQGGNDEMRLVRVKLINLLEQKLDADLEMIFRLLGLHYASQEMLNVYKVLRSNAQDTRTDALEFLESLMEPNLKKVIMPIVEAAVWDSITEDAIRKLKIRIPGEYQCYKMLLEGQHRKLKQTVLQLFRVSQDMNYLPLIEMATHDNDPRIREYAQKTFEQMSEHSTR